MLLLPHTLVGLAAASVVKNPFLVAILSFALHFFMDKVPHWDFYSNTKNDDGSRTTGWRIFAFIVDFGIALCVGLFFVFNSLWYLGDSFLAINFLIGAVFSNLPDALEAPYVFHMNIYKKSKFLQKFTDFQRFCQTQAPLPWGILTQVVVSLVCVFLLIR